MCGTAMGALAGSNVGGLDAWLARYDSSGNQLWQRQIGTSGNDQAAALAPGVAGGVFVSGTTSGSLGGANSGATDAWLASYSASGNVQWTRILGSSSVDECHGCSQTNGGVIVSGRTDGAVTGPNWGGSDIWLACYSDAGALAWVRQVGTGVFDSATDSIPDGAGGVYLCGTTAGDLGGANAGLHDAWLARLDFAGSKQWTVQLGSPADDHGFCASADGAGGVLWAGSTGGDLVAANQGGTDAWVARYGGDCGAANYCTALTSTSGCLPSMGSAGSASLASPAGFLVNATNLESGQNGLLYFGTTGKNNLPFNGGTLCVKAPHYRLPVQNAGGAGICGGSIGYTLAQFLAHPTGGPLLVGGTHVNCQVWFRDPPAAFTVGLTDGLQFTVCP